MQKLVLYDRKAKKGKSLKSALSIFYGANPLEVTMSDPYKVLGVSPNATDDEIKTAYRELAKKISSG